MSIKIIAVAAVILGLAGCSSTEGTSTLVRPPASVASSFTIRYIQGKMTPAPQSAQTPQAITQLPSPTDLPHDEMLRRAGYDDLPARVERLAPELLASQKITVHVYGHALPASDQPAPSTLAESLKNPSGQRLLLIKPVSSVSLKDASDIEITFAVQFRDSGRSGAVYWSGLYRSEAVTSMSKTTFDDDAVRHLLQHIFDDMEAAGLIGPPKA